MDITVDDFLSKMIALFLAAVMACLAHGCIQGDGSACESQCRTPPPNRCLDASTLRVYRQQGDCNRDSGTCVYGFNDVPCVPRPDECKDASTLLAATCSCSPELGACEHGTTEQVCPYGCENNRCAEHPDKTISLQVPPGSGLCVPADSFAEKATISGLLGEYVVPRENGSYEVDILEEQLLLGPDGHAAWQSGPGILEVYSNSTSLHLEYTQPFQDAGTMYDVHLKYTFVIEDESGERIELDFNDYAGGELHDSESGRCLTTCQPQDGWEPGLKVVCLPDSALIELWFTVGSEKCIHAGGGPCELYEFDFRYGEEQRIVKSYFDLACGCGHHCESVSLEARLDPPFGQIEEIRVDLLPYDTEDPPRVVYWNESSGVVAVQYAVPCD